MRINPSTRKARTMAIVSRLSVIALLTVVCVLLPIAVSIDQKQLLVNIETGINKGKPTVESDKMFLHEEKTKLVKDVLGMLSSSRVGLAGNKPTQRTSKSTSFLPPRFQGSRGHLQSELAVSKASPNHFAGSPCDHSMSDFLARCVFEDYATP